MTDLSCSAGHVRVSAHMAERIGAARERAFVAGGGSDVRAIGDASRRSLDSAGVRLGRRPQVRVAHQLQPWVPPRDLCGPVNG